MKVVLVSSGVLPVPVKAYGGLEQVVYDLAIELDKAGHDTYVVAPSESTIHNESGVKLIDCGPCLSNAHQWEQDAYNKIKPMMLSEEYKDAIWHDHSWRKFTYLAKMEHPHLHVCSTLHGMLPYQSPPPIPKPSIIGISKSHADQISAGLGVRARYVYNGIDVDKYKMNGHDRTNRYLFLGRITTYKGPHVFLDIMKNHGYEGDIVGDDTLVENADFVDRVLMGCNDYPNVSYWGEVPRDRAVEFFQTSKAYISPLLPEWKEPFGLSLVESMACGCPVIATNSGATSELIEHGVSGYIAENTADIDQYLTDESLNKITAENLRQRAEVFSRKNMMENYVTIYEDVVKGGF